MVMVIEILKVLDSEKTFRVLIYKIIKIIIIKLMQPIITKLLKKLKK